MIKFRLIDNRTRVSKRIRELEQKLEELPKEFMRLTADYIIELSPVDTGTYMDAHQIGETIAPTNSRGKPRNQSYSDYAKWARDRLYMQIENLPKEDSKYFISNNSQHAWRVEYQPETLKDSSKGAPYTLARAKAPIFLEEATRRVGL